MDIKGGPRRRGYRPEGESHATCARAAQRGRRRAGRGALRAQPRDMRQIAQNVVRCVETAVMRARPCRSPKDAVRACRRMRPPALDHSTACSTGPWWARLYASAPRRSACDAYSARPMRCCFTLLTCTCPGGRCCHAACQRLHMVGARADQRWSQDGLVSD